MTKALIACGLDESDIGIISPYRSQLRLLESKLKSYPQVEVLTMDRFQGRDKKCCILSFVRSNTNLYVGDLIRDWRRINVAFTRAKNKLLMVGSKSTLESCNLFKDLITLCESRDWVYDLPLNAQSMHHFQENSSRSPVLESKTATPRLFKKTSVASNIVNEHGGR